MFLESIRIEPLSSGHDRNSFDCGVPSLNDFLWKYAGQYDRRRLAKTYVAVVEGQTKVEGYYSISNSRVSYEAVPERNLPRSPLPTVLLGRLAVDKEHQGKGLGRVLLVHALRTASRLADEIGIWAVEVDALDEKACDFYAKFAFTRLTDGDLHLYMTIKEIRQLSL